MVCCYFIFIFSAYVYACESDNVMKTINNRHYSESKLQHKREIEYIRYLIFAAFKDIMGSALILFVQKSVIKIQKNDLEAQITCYNDNGFLSITN